MAHRIACFTLFDITKTGVLNRAKPPDDADFDSWINQRASQCNFDTILQIISLRAQPDNMTIPVRKVLDLTQSHNFGLNYVTGSTFMWTFDFEVQNISVFDDGTDSLGSLYSDSQGVPMVNTVNQLKNLELILDVTKQKRNIYFVKYNYE